MFNYDVISNTRIGETQRKVNGWISRKKVRTRKTQWEEEDEMIRRALREAAQIATIVFSIVAIIFSIIALMQ